MAGPIIFVLLYLLISSLSPQSRASRRSDREERQLHILIKEEEKVKKRWANQGKTDDGKDLPSDPMEYWRIFHHEIKQVQKRIYVPSQRAIKNSLYYV